MRDRSPSCRCNRGRKEWNRLRDEVGWVGEPDPWMGATGAKGIGEGGIVGVPAAISNAVFDATGVRVRELPFTPGRVLEAWEALG